MNICDECYTMDSSWDLVLPFLPKDKLLYDPFKGESFVRWAKEHGLEACTGDDFWGEPIPPGCVVVTNPPFTIRAEVIQTLFEKQVPFLMLCNYGTLRMNVMNRLTDARFVFWGHHHLFQLPNGKTQRSFCFLLAHGITTVPKFTWVKCPVKTFPSALCGCGCLVQKHHQKNHCKQKYHKDRCPPQ